MKKQARQKYIRVLNPETNEITFELENSKPKEKENINKSSDIVKVKDQMKRTVIYTFRVPVYNNDIVIYHYYNLNSDGVYQNNIDETDIKTIDELLLMM